MRTKTHQRQRIAKRQLEKAMAENKAFSDALLPWLDPDAPKYGERMRKDKPTMSFFVDNQLDEMPGVSEYDSWLMSCVVAEPTKEGTRAVYAPMPPIRCTMPVPCGHCWYCKQAEAR